MSETPTRESFAQYMAGLPEPVLPERLVISQHKYMALLIDSRKAELSRIRRGVKLGKRKTLTSRFLELIDRRILEFAQKMEEDTPYVC